MEVGGDDVADSVTGDQRHRDEQRRHHEQLEARGVGGVQQELPTGHAAHRDHHVDTEQPAPGLVGGEVVEPTLGDDVEAGHAEAGDEPHHDPGRRHDREGVGEHRGGAQRRQRCEHPDVTDGADGGGDRAAAGEEAGEVGGHDEARAQGRKALRLGADADQ